MSKIKTTEAWASRDDNAGWPVVWPGQPLKDDCGCWEYWGPYPEVDTVPSAIRPGQCKRVRITVEVIEDE